MKKIIKLFDPFISNSEKLAVQRVLKSGFWASGAGIGHVEEFEKKFCKHINARDCLAVNSGTAALHIACSLSNIKNKEVILPSLSFVSTANVILYNGGIPIFADVDKKNLCLDYNDVEKKITKKTAMIIPVHFGGMPAELKKFLKISKQNNLILVEDAAHAAGSTYMGKKIGSHGHFVCFSFHPVKNLSMPTGGLISINQPEHDKIRKKIMSLRWCGITNRKNYSYDIKELGWNYYMNEFSAVIGLEQLKKLDKMNIKRKIIAKRYSEELKIGEKMEFVQNCAYHLYWILVSNRTRFMKNMKDEGIETGIHYKPITKMTLYKTKTKLQVTDSISTKIVSIPIYPNLSEADIQKIITCVNKYS